MNDGASLIQADATSIPLADDSVDAVITSPPYFSLRSYQDGGEHYDGQIGSEATPGAFLEALWAVTAECKRVLKPSGSMFVNLGDKYAERAGPGREQGNRGDQDSATYRKAKRPQRRATGVRAKSLHGMPWRYAIGCIDDLDLILRAEIVWSKPNGLPESVTDRVRRSHEQWFHLTKEPRYYTAIDELREPSTTPVSTAAKHSTRRQGQTDGTRGTLGFQFDAPHPLGKLPGSVWTVPTEPLKIPAWLGIDHFAAFPQEFPRRFILGWSPPGICVECGQGRRPEVDKALDVDHVQTATVGRRDSSEANGNSRGMNGTAPVASTVATITGYRCDCDTPTAPTQPAIILDPFAGTGTVPMVARALGRHGIGIDLSADYLRLATWRVFTSGHGAKSEARTNADRQPTLL